MCSYRGNACLMAALENISQAHMTETTANPEIPETFIINAQTHTTLITEQRNKSDTCFWTIQGVGE